MIFEKKRVGLGSAPRVYLGEEHRGLRAREENRSEWEGVLCVQRKARRPGWGECVKRWWGAGIRVCAVGLDVERERKQGVEDESRVSGQSRVDCCSPRWGWEGVSLETDLSVLFWTHQIFRMLWLNRKFNV